MSHLAEGGTPWSPVKARFAATLAAIALLAAPAPAQEPARDASGDAIARTEVLKERTSVTHHSIQIGGHTLRYTATAGTVLLRDEKDKPQASVFYVAYTRDGVADRSRRPILYSFNGGPGAASVWMHMGFTGPRRVAFDDEGFMLEPPFRLLDNDHTVLDVADIVYIDPVGTGFSRMAPGEDPHKFHGVIEDIRSIAEFMHIFTTRNNRWGSPKFLIGESYGTTRAAGLVEHLQQQHQMYFNGVILVSMTDLDVQPGVDLGYALSLPHYTATAWYHKALPPNLLAKPLLEVLSQSERFALGAYLAALVKGDRISDGERRSVAGEVARLSGLSPEYVLNTNLRVDRGRFRKELLRARGLTVGRMDSRYLGRDRDSAGENSEFDPALASWAGPFAAVVNEHLRQDLKWESDARYNLWGAVQPWRRDAATNVGEMLRRAMTQNPYLRVLVLAGYYDGATDYFSTQYTMSHLDPGGTIKDRISFAFYDSGHMMYLRKKDLAKAKRDLERFVSVMGSKPSASKPPINPAVLNYATAVGRSRNGRAAKAAFLLQVKTEPGTP